MRRIAGLVAVFFLIVYIFAYIEFANMPVSVLLTEEQAKKAYYRERETILLDFLLKYMICEDGAVRSSIKASEAGEDTLSESIGILMNYCIIRDRRDLFDRELRFLTNKLLANGTYIRWRYGKSKTCCNAAIDDLRIIGALLDAHTKWQDRSYFNTAVFIQDGLYKKQIFDGNLCEFYDWHSDTVRKSIPLCYIDLYNIYRMSIFNKNWIKIADNGLTVIRNGRASDASPFFSKYYNYETCSYSLDEEFQEGRGICATYSIYTALHLAECNQDTEYFTQWLKDEMKKGKLYAWYDPYTLSPSQEMESTAVYALAAVYAKKVREEKLYRSLLGRMLKFMVVDKESLYYGGFGNTETGDFHCFDNLTALWALSLADK